jgi:hypothetical protein
MKFTSLKIAVAALTFALVNSAAFASANLTIQLQGTVASVCQWAATAGASNQPMDLSTAKTALTVAYLGHSCNAPKGWTIKAESANGGKLVSADKHSINYEVKLSSASSFTKLDSQKTLLDTSFIAFGEVGRSLQANIDAGQYAGTYSDTVTVTLTAK